jgi:hypothetical protein
MLWQGMQESRLNDDTVRYRWLAIKRKSELCCAETVNVRSSLWKARENPTTIFLHAQSRVECTKAAATTITVLKTIAFQNFAAPWRWQEFVELVTLWLIDEMPRGSVHGCILW